MKSPMEFNFEKFLVDYRQETRREFFGDVASHLSCLMVHGSHLYGLDTENSDVDYKGIFSPSMELLFTEGPEMTISKSTKEGEGKNTKDDQEVQLYSIGTFINLAKRGEMIAMDMLHAPESMIQHSSPEWKYIQANREVFYSKNMQAYLGYIRRQVNKYGVKGSRINQIETALKILPDSREPFKGVVNAMLEAIPDTVTLVTTGANGKLESFWLFLGNQYAFHSPCSEVRKSLLSILKGYGKRAQQAALNEGVDWKAVSHAFRACWQFKELLKYGTMTLPLSHEARRAILPIKLGQVPWKDCERLLDEELLEIKWLTDKSRLPETTDPDKIREVLIEAHYIVRD